MPTLHSAGKWKIAVYRDHNPPHFHVIFSDGRDAQIGIADLSVIESELRPALLKPALAWAAAHGDELVAAWRRCND